MRYFFGLLLICLLILVFPCLSSITGWSYTEFFAWLISSTATVAFSIGISAAGACGWWRYNAQVSQLVAALDHAIQAVTEKDWNDLEKADFQAGLFPLFEQFRKTVRAETHPADEGEPPRVAMYALQPASSFFTEDAVYYGSVNVALFQAVPGILTGLGISFTFVGLAAGVYLATPGLLLGSSDAAMASPDIASILSAIGKLLDGASQAFVTSIVGLFASLIFGCGLHSREHRLFKDLCRLNDALERKAPFKSTEELLAAIAKNAEQQELSITEIKKTMDASVDRLIEGISASNSKLSEEQARRIEDGFAKMTDVLNNFNKNIGESVANGAANAAKQFSEALEHVVRDMASTFETSAEGVQTAAAGIDVTANKLHDTVIEIGEKTVDLITLLDKQQKIVADAIQTVDSQLKSAQAASENIAVNLTKGGDELSGKLDSAGNAFLSLTGDAGEALIAKSNEAGASLLTHVDEAGAKFVGHVTAAGSEFGDALRADAKAVEETLVSGAQALRSTLDEALEKHRALEKAFQEQSGTLQEHLNNLSNTLVLVKQAMDSVLSTQGRVIETSNEADKTNKGLQLNAEKIAATYEKTLQQVNDQLHLSIATQKMFAKNAEQLETLLTTMVQDLGSSLEKLHSSVRQNLQQMDSQLAQAVLTLSSGLGDVSDIQSLSLKNLESLLVSIDQSAKRLRASIDERQGQSAGGVR